MQNGAFSGSERPVKITLSPCFGKRPFVSRQRLGFAQTPHRSWVRRALWAPRSFHLCDKCSYEFELSSLRVSREDPQRVVLEASLSSKILQQDLLKSAVLLALIALIHSLKAMSESDHSGPSGPCLPLSQVATSTDCCRLAMLLVVPGNGACNSGTCTEVHEKSLHMLQE